MSRCQGGFPTLIRVTPYVSDRIEFSKRHENACLLDGQNLDHDCHRSQKNPDEISGDRRDSKTLTKGPTLTTLAPAFEG